MDFARKRAVRAAVVSCLCIFAVWGAFSDPARADAFEVQAGSAVLMDVSTKRLLYEQDSNRKIPPASLTKVMSMYVVLDEVKAGKVSLRSLVRIGKNAAHTGGSNMHLKAGELVRLDDLLRGMAVASANDASAAVAEHVAGSQQAFVQMMNRKAAQIGMPNTRFMTPHGLPAKGQFTTAADMLRLARSYLEAHPSARWYHSTPAIYHNGIVMQNTNKLLGHDEISGLKTGFTRASGFNIILTTTRHGKEMIAVLMRTPSVEVRTREAQRLLDYGEHLQANMNKSDAEKTEFVPSKATRKAEASASVRKAGSGKKKQKIASAPAKKKKLAVSSRKNARSSDGIRRILPETAGLGAKEEGTRAR